jgi:hypothetical protein
MTFYADGQGDEEIAEEEEDPRLTLTLMFRAMWRWIARPHAPHRNQEEEHLEEDLWLYTKEGIFLCRSWLSIS